MHNFAGIRPKIQPFNVAEAGATGDGITDDAAAINSVLEREASVYIPAGRYRVTRSLVIQSGTTLLMDPTAVIVRDRSGTGPQLATLRNKNQHIHGDTNITVIGGSFEAVDPRQTGRHLGMVGTDSSRFDGINFGQVYGDWTTSFAGDNIVISNINMNTDGSSKHEDGIHLTGGNHITVSTIMARTGDDCISLSGNPLVADLSDVEVRSVRGQTVHNSSIIKVDVGSGQYSVSNVRIHDVTGTGAPNGFPIKIIDDTKSRRVSNVTLEDIDIGCKSGGLWAEHAHDLKLRKIRLSYAKSTSFKLIDCSGLELAECQVAQPAPSGNPAVDLLRCRDFNISGGLIENSPQHSIRISDCAEGRITGVTIRNGAAIGVLVVDSRDIEIFANTITGHGSAAIVERKAGAGNVFHGNVVRGNRSGQANRTASAGTRRERRRDGEFL